MTRLATGGRGLKRVLTATRRQLGSPHRREAVRLAMQNWVFTSEAAEIPAAYPQQLWPEMREVQVPLVFDGDSNFELPLGERAILAGLVRLKKPRTIFELGTFIGTTTVLFAESAPSDTRIHTIDQPESAFPANGIDGWFTSDMIGRHFVDRPDYGDRITLHRCDIKDFDFTPFRGGVDLVFVDADHTYAAVLRDSRLALDLVAPGGIIVWDDYQPTQWGVVRGVNEIAASVPLRRIAHTRFVVHEAPGPAAS